MSNINEIQIQQYMGADLAKKDIRKFRDIIYKNFEHIADIEELNHTAYEIFRLLISSLSIVFIAIYNKKIIGYIVAEITEIDSKRLLHIAYLYVVPTYRKNGVGTYLLNRITQSGIEYNADAISLTFDTYNKKLENFYFSNYFNYDPNFRSKQRYDMMLKKLK